MESQSVVPQRERLKIAYGVGAKTETAAASVQPERSILMAITRPGVAALSMTAILTNVDEDSKSFAAHILISIN